MESQLAAAIGAVFGVVVTAVISMANNRQALLQRQREQVVALAYEAAIAEFKAALEIGPKLHPSGNFIAASFSTYLVYHLTLSRHLISGHDVKGLDDETVADALHEAKRLSVASRDANFVAGEKK